MLGVRLLSLVIFSSLIVSQANGMHCVHGGLARSIPGQEQDKQEQPNFREILLEGWAHVRSRNDEKVLEWCKKLVQNGKNPSAYFSMAPGPDLTFMPIYSFMIIAAIYNMSKVLKYLLDMHEIGLDCGFDFIFPGWERQTAGERALEYARHYKNLECAGLLEEAIRAADQKARL